MWLLITVGSQIGALPTIGLVLLTAVVGLALLRQQGISTLLKANQRMQTGQIPAQEMAEGIFLAVGGALLLTPGFITDAIGFACLIPGIRKVLLGLVLKRWQVVQVRRYQQYSGFRDDSSQQSNRTIDGDFQRHDRDKD